MLIKVTQFIKSPKRWVIHLSTVKQMSFHKEEGNTKESSISEHTWTPRSPQRDMKNRKKMTTLQNWCRNRLRIVCIRALGMDIRIWSLMNRIMIRGLGDLRTERGVYLCFTTWAYSKVQRITQVRSLTQVSSLCFSLITVQYLKPIEATSPVLFLLCKTRGLGK